MSGVVKSTTLTEGIENVIKDKMKTFFEYLYYRIAKLNFVKNFERATISVTMCQALLIVNIIFFFNLRSF